eukprot:XP_011677210.1 PREDICTED: uncharacterized protein LOC100891585 [Strongylocentrotus purpuratus]
MRDMMVGIYYSRACFIPAVICLLWLCAVKSEEGIGLQHDVSNEEKVDLRSASRSLTDWRHRVRRASLTSVWSSWSGWSACSRTCGGGAQFRTRHCMSRLPMRYMTRAITCPGDRRQYQTCNTESTNKKQVPQPEETPPSSPARDEKRPALKSSDKQTKGKNKNNKSRKEKCGKCKRVKGRAEHYCGGSYAILFEVVGQTAINGETRYDVAIEESFKNNMQLNRREYLWVTNSCPCPKLRTGSRYISTGDRVTSLESGESRLTLERENLVVKYKPGLRESWNRLQRKEESICSKFL